MKSKEKKMLLILILVSVLIIGVIYFVTRPKDEAKETAGKTSSTTTAAAQGEFTKVEEDGTVVNTSEKLKENKEIEGFTITDITFEEKNGVTELVARVTNKTGKAHEAFGVNIVLYDKAGNEIAKIPGNIVETQPGETIRIRAGITESYANAYDFKLEK